MRTTITAAVLLVSITFLCGPVVAGGKDVCVSVSDMYRGRNCGSADSVQVSVKNDCGVKVKGALIFEQESGDPIRYPMTLSAGGDRQIVFVCHGNGTVGKDFDVER